MPESTVGVLLFAPLALCALGILFCTFMLYRVRWVYRTRVRILYSSRRTPTHGHEPYDSLPSFDEMVAKFWIWDARRFLPPHRRSEIS